MTPKRKNTEKAKHLLFLDEYPKFKRWFDSLKRGSENTAHERARVLVRYCIKYKLTPDSLIQLAKSDITGLEDQFDDFLTEMHNKGRSPGYLSSYLKSIRSWLEFNKLKFERKFNLGNIKETPTIENEIIPNKKELKTILNYANERGKVIISLIAFSGLRPQVLGNGLGTNGLKIKDFPELKIKNNEITFEVSPTLIIISSKLSKSNQKYITFLCEEGMDYLKLYLEKRLAIGESLNLESPIITPRYKYNIGRKNSNSYGSEFIKSQNISREVREAMRPRFNWRPYVLRSYFDSMLMLAESHGKISHPYRQQFMGHIGDIEARYSTNKRLPGEIIEDMRRAYSESEEYFTTYLPITNNLDMIEKRITNKLVSEFAILNLSKSEKRELFERVESRLESKLNGIQREDVDEKKVLDMETELLKEEFAKRFLHIPQVKTNFNDNGNNNNNRHKIITENKLVKYLDEGWKIVDKMNGDKYLVKKD